jgi:hypothetical protein
LIGPCGSWRTASDAELLSPFADVVDRRWRAVFGSEGLTDRPADFFVSYTSADPAWGKWISWQLEAEGF